VAWKHFYLKEIEVEGRAPRSIIRAALVNLLNPNPYIYWSLVTGPVLLNGWRQTPANGLAFLVSFYAALVVSLAAIIIVSGVAGRMGPKVNRALLGVSCIALLCFGCYQLWRGLVGA
jgi:threonine/homoserine/homoserine lactone efflux protein